MGNLADKLRLMDDIFGVGKVVEKLADPIADIVKRVAGPAADEVGLTLQDSVRVYRARRGLRLFEKFKENCRKRGFSPKQVPLKLLLPILDSASVEDDEDLHTAWASLLTDAADPSGSPKPYRAFVEILKQISAEDARFYQALFDEIEIRVKQWNKLSEFERVSQSYSHPLRLFPTYDLVKIYLESNHLPVPVVSESDSRLLPSPEVSLSGQNLQRLGLLPANLSDFIPHFALQFAASTRAQATLNSPVDIPDHLMPMKPPKD